MKYRIIDDGSRFWDVPIRIEELCTVTGWNFKGCFFTYWGARHGLKKLMKLPKEKIVLYETEN